VLASDGVRAVASVTARLWTREIAELFRVSERRVSLMVALGVATAIFFGVVLAIVGSSGLEPAMPVALRSTLVGTSVGGAVMTSGIVATIVSISAPARTALQTLLDLLPVSRTNAQVGQLLPLVGLALVFSVALSAVSFAVGFTISPSTVWSVGFTAALLASIVLASIIVFGLFRVIRWCLIVGARLPHQYAVTVAGSMTLTLSVATVAPDIFALRIDNNGWEPRELLLHRALASASVSNYGFAPWGVLLVWLAVGILAVRSLGWTATSDHGSGSTRALVGLSVPRTRAAAATWVQVLAAVRSPQAIVTVLVIPALVAGAWLLSERPLLGSVAQVFAAAAPSVPFLLAMFAVGRVLPLRWWGAQLTARPTWWAWPTAVGHLLIGTIVAVPVVVVELALGTLQAADLGAVAARAAFAFAAALVAGALVPYSEEQPLSATISGFIAALLYTGNAVVTPVIADGLGTSAMPIVTASTAVALLALFGLIINRYASHGDVRA